MTKVVEIVGGPYDGQRWVVPGDQVRFALPPVIEAKFSADELPTLSAPVEIVLPVMSTRNGWRVYWPRTV